MRSFWRILEPPLLRDIGLVCLADGVVGVSFGALAVSGGEPPWVPVVMSLAVFAGGAQFAALGVVLGGGGAVAAVVMGLVLNARLLPYGFAVADVLDLRRLGRWSASHLLIDESVAFVMAERDPARRRAVYLTCGILMFLVWNLGTVLGVLAGGVVGDPAALGLDAASPVVLLALVLPALRDPVARGAALVGAVVALAGTPFLPPGVPVLLALTGLMVLVRSGTGDGSGTGDEPGTGDGSKEVSRA